MMNTGKSEPRVTNFLFKNNFFRSPRTTSLYRIGQEKNRANRHAEMDRGGYGGSA